METVQQVAADNSVNGLEPYIFVCGANRQEVEKAERGGRHKNPTDLEIGDGQDIRLKFIAADADVYIVFICLIYWYLQRFNKVSVEAAVVGTGVDKQAYRGAVQSSRGDDMKALRVKFPEPPSYT